MVSLLFPLYLGRLRYKRLDSEMKIEINSGLGNEISCLPCTPSKIRLQDDYSSSFLLSVSLSIGCPENPQLGTESLSRSISWQRNASFTRRKFYFYVTAHLVWISTFINCSYGSIYFYFYLIRRLL